MSTFDNLIHEIDARYRLGTKAAPLVNETVRLVSKQPGGVRGFVQKFKIAGFAVEAASWLDGCEPVPLSGQEVEEALGSDAVIKFAANIGLSQTFTRTILGYAIPQVVARLAKGGAISAAFRAFAERLVAAASPRAPSFLEGETKLEAARIRAGTAQYGRAAQALGGLIIPCTTGLIALGLLAGYLIGAGDRGPAQPRAAVAQSTPVVLQSIRPAPAPLPLSIENNGLASMAASGAIEAPTAPPAVSGDGEKRRADSPNKSATEFPAIYFATNRAKPVPASRPAVAAAARLITHLPAGTVVEVQGYTDTLGSPAANMRLSERRANAIRNALVRAGSDPAMLTAKGYGSFHPTTLAGQPETVEGRSNALTAERRRSDRRVEFGIRQR